MVSWEVLASRIRDNEVFLETYQRDPLFKYVGEVRHSGMDFYLRLYLGEINMENTPIYAPMVDQVLMMFELN